MVIFGYQCAPSYGMIGSEGGFSFDVLDNATVDYKTYLFSQLLTSWNSYSIDPALCARITEEVEASRKAVEVIPQNLNNGSCDGNMNRFTFWDRQITAWNISAADPEHIMKTNPGYFMEYRDNIFHENFVLSLFKRIAKVLEGADIRLNESSIRFNQTGCMQCFSLKAILCLRCLTGLWTF